MPLIAVIIRDPFPKLSGQRANSLGTVRSGVAKEEFADGFLSERPSLDPPTRGPTVCVTNDRNSTHRRLPNPCRRPTVGSLPIASAASGGCYGDRTFWFEVSHWWRGTVDTLLSVMPSPSPAQPQRQFRAVKRDQHVGKTLWTFSQQAADRENIQRCATANMLFGGYRRSVRNVNMMTVGRCQYATVIQYQTISLTSLYKLL
ncbi:uncharacterized protein LOC133902011 [Phragmites australis]|uniref:uncharacterized protein LOC133902011 n=1 Tax=Phragmites australis TaxID=29695 RepID=UPI002D76D4E7|nr:uncharacterized protein LOC133902011 [Phragmites australis]